MSSHILSVFFSCGILLWKPDLHSFDGGFSLCFGNINVKNLFSCSKNQFFYKQWWSLIFNLLVFDLFRRWILDDCASLFRTRMHSPRCKVRILKTKYSTDEGNDLWSLTITICSCFYFPSCYDKMSNSEIGMIDLWSLSDTSSSSSNTFHTLAPLRMIDAPTQECHVRCWSLIFCLVWSLIFAVCRTHKMCDDGYEMGLYGACIRPPHAGTPDVSEEGNVIESK